MADYLVLYLRHRLQKGFLARNQAPKDEDMENMSAYITQLEGFDQLEPDIIKNTKVHKVLKGLIKLGSIPRDDEFNFKQRSTELLAKWNTVLEADAPDVTGLATNGVKQESKKVEVPAEKKTQDEATIPDDSNAKDVDGDVVVPDADQGIRDGASTSKTEAVPGSETGVKVLEAVTT